MNEQTKTTTQIRETPGGPGIFDNPDDADDQGIVRITSGLHATSLPVGGMSVGEIRRRFADVLGIGPENTAIIDGQQAGEDTVVRTGQNVLFVQQGGEKGYQGSLRPGARLLATA